jgi:undecaprenyl phosphate-alpha-L-ara4FN deformylase
MTPPTIAIKVDVDTHAGTRDGVPRLLEIFESFGIRATFYFSMGPDNSGKAIRRIFTRKGFLKRMLRNGAPSTYGLRTLLYGTLLQPPMIASSFPEILRKTAKMGHETGIHCWDHVRWHDLLPKMTRETVAGELERAAALFREIFGLPALTTAAPGWTVSADSLSLQDGMALRYCSDSRGRSPFYPVVDGRPYKTLQLPTTLPTMDELLGTGGISADNINSHYISLIQPGLNVHTIHAELEGMRLNQVFIDLIRRLRAMDARFVTLAESAGEAEQTAPPCCLLAMGEIPGRTGLVAVQGTEVESSEF